MPSTRRTRVLFITHSMVLGGAPTSLDLLVRGLDPERYECVIACIHPTPVVVDFHRQAGVEVIPAPGIVEFPHTTGGWLRLWNPRHLWALARAVVRYRPSVAATQALIARVEPDIVHLNSVILAPAADAARHAGVPLVWHVRESVVHGHLGLRHRWLARKVRELPDVAVFLSDDDRARLGPSRDNWVVIPNWTRFEPDAPASNEARGSLGIPRDAPVLLFLGGLSRLKGCDVLLRAMPSVAAARPEVICLLAGVIPRPAPTFRRRIRARLAHLGFPDDRTRCERLLGAAPNVRTVEFRPETEDLFAATDVLVFPAVEPHFPRPVIEAFARQVPVVASDLGPIRDVVPDGGGRLVPPGDAPALAEGILEVLEDPTSAKAMAERARRAGAVRYSAQAGVAAIEDVYRRVIR